MFESLSDKLDGAFKKLAGQATINEINIGIAMRDIKRALLGADVNYKVVKKLVEDVRQKSLGEGVIKSVSPAQMIVKIVSDELTELMGGEQKPLALSSSRLPAVVMVAGLQGSGKTTFAAKLAKRLKKSGRNPLLVAADVYRPAAVDQLKTLGAEVSVPVFSIEEKDAMKVAMQGLEAAKAGAHDVLIVDTAGRLQIDDAMMAEAEALKNALKPDELLFVVDSMMGQEAVNTAKAFNDRLDFDGVVLTKLDGDSRGGAALSIRHVVEKPIKFMSVGEKVDDLDQFYPDRMAQRILGMGDIVSFVEKAQESLDMEATLQMQKKLMKNEFDLNDFFDQLQQLKKMGSMQSLIEMVPGLNKMVPKQDLENLDFKPIEAIISSMTKEEKSRPEIINGSRRQRIALGSGTRVQDVNMLLKQFGEMKKMMRSVSKLSGNGRKITSQNLALDKFLKR
ncbi:signal recognition particle protein [Chlorobium phaeovibrioides]|uniref:Signal recognition particle protein n=1 Tax=Chlorobium phaeovibrioides TaxID=1094 RepID=A0A3S0U2L1_CHLPH|nr:signal recognition particle protein [Chlorobium phaeovibrioides]KAA6232633.1 signal recognition particle protein [Chlorobium phaeovibrioides]MWV53705.1 signal recognition particle protein [Chlorobium phaeovibrioides]RTY37437.1 signal recognition particle protein [Chlorobium phaeovibrioides]RTY39931.1 signal recognition particle protein [Chlorobium phaeovibrioides]